MRNVTLIKNSTGEKGEEISSAQMYLASSGETPNVPLSRLSYSLSTQVMRLIFYPMREKFAFLFFKLRTISFYSLFLPLSPFSSRSTDICRP